MSPRVRLRPATRWCWPAWGTRSFPRIMRVTRQTPTRHDKVACGVRQAWRVSQLASAGGHHLLRLASRLGLRVDRVRFSRLALRPKRRGLFAVEPAAFSARHITHPHSSTGYGTNDIALAGWPGHDQAARAARARHGDARRWPLFRILALRIGDGGTGSALGFCANGCHSRERSGSGAPGARGGRRIDRPTSALGNRAPGTRSSSYSGGSE
jgi:hypothetical protein